MCHSDHAFVGSWLLEASIIRGLEVDSREGGPLDASPGARRLI